jgi:predicted PurR-regulated permease PerM
MLHEPPPPWNRLHLWQIQLVKDAVVVVALLACAYLAYRLRSIVIPMFLGLFIAGLIEPAVARGMSWHRSITRARVVIASAVLGLLAFAGLLMIAVPPAVSQGRQLARELPGYLREAVALSERPFVPAVVREQVAALRDAVLPRLDSQLSGPSTTDGAVPMGPLENAPATVVVQHIGKEEKKEDSIRVFARNGMTVVNVVVESLAQIFDVVVFLFLVPFFAIVFSLHFPRVRQRLRELPPEPHRERLAGVARRMERSVGGFFRGRVMVCLILAGVYAVGLSLCAVPYGVLLGLLTGLLCLIPYLHFIGLPLAWALLAFHLNDASGPSGLYATIGQDGAIGIEWWRVALLPLSVWVVAQVLDDYLLSPLIQGQTTDLHPATILVSIIAGGVIGGFYGIIVAVPVVACAKIVIEAFAPSVRGWLRGDGSSAGAVKP